MQLAEKYRPRTWEQFIGQPKAVARVREVVGRPGFGVGGGEAFWISGASGTGKSTMAGLIARSLGVNPERSWNYAHLDGDKCTVKEVRQLEVEARAASMFTDWRIIVVDEAHSITPGAVQAWLTLLERLPAKWVIVFTTTEHGNLFGDFSRPFFRRCKVVEFTTQGLAQPAAARVKEIAQEVGLDGKPLSFYVRLAQECHNSIGDMLQHVDLGEMTE